MQRLQQGFGEKGREARLDAASPPGLAARVETACQVGQVDFDDARGLGDLARGFADQFCPGRVGSYATLTPALSQRGRGRFAAVHGHHPALATIDARERSQGGADPCAVGYQIVLHRPAGGDASHVRHGQALNGRAQVVQGTLGDDRGDLGAQAHCARVLVDDAQATRAAHRLQQRVQRVERARVDDLHLDALGGELLSRRQRLVQHPAPGHHRHVLAVPRDVGTLERQDVIALGDLAADRAVGTLVLQEQHRIGMTDGTGEQALGIARKARRHHAQAWHVRVVGLDALRVIRAAAQATTVRGADHQRAGGVAVGPKANARGVGNDVVGSGVDEVGELDLGDRPQAAHGHAHGEARDAELHHGRVDNAFRPKFRQQAVRGAKDAAEGSDVLAENHHALVTLHLLSQGLADGLNERHGPSPSSGLRRCHMRNVRRHERLVLMIFRGWPTRGGATATLQGLSSRQSGCQMRPSTRSCGSGSSGRAHRSSRCSTMTSAEMAASKASSERTAMPTCSARSSG